MERDDRVRAIPETRGIRAGAEGTIVYVDPEDGMVLVEWDGSQSGPCWHEPDQIEKRVKLTRDDYRAELARRKREES